MEVLNERGAVIITHPHKPATNNESLTSVVPLASYEYLAETTRAILNMIGHNVMLRYPKLKVKAPVLVKNLATLKSSLADIAPDDIENILYNNAKRIFVK